MKVPQVRSLINAYQVLYETPTRCYTKPLPQGAILRHATIRPLSCCCAFPGQWKGKTSIPVERGSQKFCSKHFVVALARILRSSRLVTPLSLFRLSGDSHPGIYYYPRVDSMAVRRHLVIESSCSGKKNTTVTAALDMVGR